MDTSDAFVGLDCTATGDRYAPDHVGRSDADAPLDPVYDLDGVDADDLPTAPDSMWEYDALLPVPADRAVSAGEGATPLLDAPDLAAEMGVGHVHLKDEGRNPTGSILDRGLSVAVTMARAHGAELLALAAPGDAGQAAAAYAGRIDTDLYAYLPSRAPFPNKAMVNVHGADMRVIGGRYPDALDALESDLQRDWYSLQAFTTPYRHDAYRTLAYEVAAERDWTAPDAVVLAVGTGETLVGVARGFQDLAALGLTERVPRCYAVQPEGCAPIVEAHDAGAADVEPVEYPDTICGELELPAPTGGAMALDALTETAGGAITVADEDLLESAVALTQRLGTEVGATGGVAAAGAWALAERGDLGADESALVVNADAGVKTADVLRSHLMGQGV
ncbi:pyridoxal-phosphate dependent enzyme [Haloplanus aerogenes]|uniref:Pyridoxal-phosphate dependent enzyme n=1 Tax=Haloplanus aerogenes TaxID=660522 RepID=A0A3M0D3N6_9EURY|nr:pyridoxal-phosphate dependent enzyme [Haloplanus aerogenes]AZH25074.1 pyridoxal-phosphate dependent enzyme [Haloplanus aerogenes]RMB13706.1 threonine synthase [Haloplanus aerogenes]